MATASAVSVTKLSTVGISHQVTDEKVAKLFELATRGGAIKGFWSVRCTLDAGSLNDAAGESDTIAVPGVALGDAVEFVSLGVDRAGITITGYVDAAGSVTLRVQNESGGTVNLASTVVRLVVLDLT